MSDADASPVSAPASKLRKLRVRIGREVRWLWVEAETARAIEAFDRFARRRAQLFRDRHATNVTEEELSTRRLNKPGKAVRVVGFLNAELEPAADRLGLKAADKPGHWEGPRVRIDRYLGDSETWTACAMGALEPIPYGAPNEPRSTQLVFRQRTGGPCPVCHDAPLGGTFEGETIVSVCCLWCGRTNVDAQILG